MVAQEHRAQTTVWNEEDLVISFVCPILVTTASLHILKFGLGLEAFQSASSLDEVAEEVDALVVYQEPGPQLHRYCRQIVQALHKQYPEIKPRLDEFEQVLEPTKERRVLPSTWAFNDNFTSATSDILVVRLDALDSLLKAVRGSVEKAGGSVRRIATLAVDLEKRTKQVVPVSE